MPIIHTNQFWDYMINESKIIFNNVKNLLTKKHYDYDTKEYKYDIYWQKISSVIIDDIEYEYIRFPSGLTPWISNTLGIPIENKSFQYHEYEEDEVYTICNEIKTINQDFEIRDYQIEAVLTSLNSFTSLIYASVGSGKTSIMSIVCKMLNKEKILILNGNNIILGQIAERLESFGITDISWNPSKEPDYTKQIVILNIAGSNSRLDRQDEKYINFLKNDVTTIIYDEAHHLQSLTAIEPILYTSPDNLKHLIGYSGSPFRDKDNPYENTDDFRTIAIIGEPAFTYEMKDAIKDGNVAQPYGYFINYKNKEAVIPEKFKDEYYMQYRFNITYNKARNKAGIEMLKFLHKNNIKTFVSFNNTKPAQARMKELKQEGISALLVCGNETIYEWVLGKRGGLVLEKRKGSKKEVLEALANEYNIIFGTSVLDEGVSIDIFQAAVLFSAGKTNIAGIQRLGRASRKRLNGKNVSFVIDFKDVNGNYIFNIQYEKRKKMMIDSGIKVFNNVLDFMNMIKEIGQEK